MKYRTWLSEWLEYDIRPSKKERTYQKYKVQVTRHILPDLGEYELNELSAVVLKQFAASFGKRYSPNTVNGILTVVKSSLKRAVALEYAEKEFTGVIVRPKPSEKRAECFSLAEQRKIERYILGGNRGSLFGVVFCLYTGVRIGELLALKWEDFHLERGVFFVSKTAIDAWQNGRYIKRLDLPKTESSYRVIPIPKQLLPKLYELKKRKKSEYFIGGKSEYGMQIRVYQKMFARLLQTLHISHRCFHVLRHTFATRALESGMDVKTLSELLGHKNSAVTLNRYAHSLMEHKREVMNRLGKLFIAEQKST